jgi:phage gp29-like protein
MSKSKLRLKNKAEDKILVMDPRDELPSIVRSITADRLMAIVDQSQNGDTRDLFALYRDIIASDNQIQSEFTKRKAAVLGDTITMIPWDKKLPADVAAKDFCWRIVESDPFNDAVNHLLNATLFPVAVCEKIYRPAGNGYILDSIIPVHYQLLDYRTGDLRIFDVDENGKAMPTSHDPDPARYIVHRGHVLPLPDTWGGPMRSILFWWLLRTMSRQWWANFLERFGVPFLKGKYSDPEGRAVLERAFRMAVRLGAIVVSKGTEVEIVQAASGDKSSSHEQFIELCNREISKLVVGQTLSANTQPTGMGEGTANLQGEVRDDLRKMDARMLAATLRPQLLGQYLAINAQTGNPPVLMFGSDSAAEMQATLGLVKSLAGSGFEPDDDGIASLSERVGFGIRRKAAAPAMMPFNVAPLNAVVEDCVSPSLSADLALAFRGRHAPVAEIIRSSATPEACVEAVRAWALNADPGRAAEIIEQALVAYAASGARSATRTGVQS